MSKPYGIISDQHFHSWSAFSSVNSDGINTRLAQQLAELVRCADEVRAAGGDTIINAGDTFHVRGSLAPSVLNPVLDVHRALIDKGFKIVILAGNHDLEGKDANRIGSAVTALEGVGCKIVNDYHTGLMALERIVMVPWTPSIKDLKDAIIRARDADPSPDEIDLFIHAPLDGVIVGLPDHGLDPAWLATLGFRRVFSGHYHHHKEAAKNVWSIGASTHHTWGDVGSKAGFLIANTDGTVRWFKSRAPEFVEIDASTDPEEIPLLADGNYVRAKINSTKTKEVEELRAYLEASGAKGVVILAEKAASATARTGSTITAGASIEVSVNDFIKGASYMDPIQLALLCQDILSEARNAA